MKCVSRRLLGHRGSSMFLAMVFFLLCFFVGGSVLAAATANAGRLSHSRQTQQEYYAQRSAVSLLREQFADPARLTLQLITTETRIIQSGSSTTMITSTDYGYQALGSTVSKANEEALNYPNQTDLQKIISKAAVAAYRNNNTDDARVGLDASDANTEPVTGSFTVSLSVDGIDDACVVYVSYTCSYDSKTDFGEVVFTVYSKDESDSEFSLSVPASVNVVKSVGSQQNANGNTVTIIRTTTESVVVTWGSPVIQKGVVTT